MKILVDRSKCIAAANCIGMAPRVFTLDGMKKAVVLDPRGADDEKLIEAAEACPTEAITLCDDETGKQIFP